MIKFRLLFVILFSIYFSSCHKASTSYNPALEGAYLCEAHIVTPGGYWSIDEEDICCPVGMTGFTDTSEQILDSVINLSFNSENTFVISDFEELSQINLNVDLTILLMEPETIDSGGLYGYFHNEDSLTIYRKIIKPSFDMPRITPTYSEVEDNYYCIKQY